MNEKERVIVDSFNAFNVESWSEADEKSQSRWRDMVRSVFDVLWQPIKTAPKDGSSVLLFGQSESGSNIWPGRWSDEEKKWQWNSEFPPSLWMLAPPIPRQATRKAVA